MDEMYSWRRAIVKAYAAALVTFGIGTGLALWTGADGPGLVVAAAAGTLAGAVVLGRWQHQQGIA